MNLTQSPVARVALAASVAASFAIISATAASAAPPHRPTLYVESNQSGVNQILGFAQQADGSLAPLAPVNSGGVGSGAGLGSQNALAVADEGRTLLAVNAGSNSVSSFAVGQDGRVRLVSTASSRGVKPISVAAHDGIVAVLNGDNTVSTLELDHGRLSGTESAPRTLVGAAPSQVSFTNNGRQIVVTERGSNQIDVAPVSEDGAIGAPVVNASVGLTPYGFAIDKGGDLIVSNAAGGAPGASSLTSYRVNGNGTLTTISPTVATGQTAACWVATTPDGRFAFTTNAGSASVSAYAIAADGSLTLSGQATTGAAPIDVIVAGGDLYTLNAAGHSISEFGIGAAGSLSAIATQTGLPAGAAGLVGA
jgi:6-phosphogluconolactonase